jgi:hypothetical protein
MEPLRSSQGAPVSESHIGHAPGHLDHFGSLAVVKLKMKCVFCFIVFSILCFARRQVSSLAQEDS